LAPVTRPVARKHSPRGSSCHPVWHSPRSRPPWFGHASASHKRPRKGRSTRPASHTPPTPQEPGGPGLPPGRPHHGNHSRESRRCHTTDRLGLPGGTSDGPEPVRGSNIGQSPACAMSSTTRAGRARRQGGGSSNCARRAGASDRVVRRLDSWILVIRPSPGMSRFTFVRAGGPRDRRGHARPTSR
jgi:hypothetical protein